MYNANHMTRQYQAYANAALTVRKTRQVVMLYDGVIRFIQQSVEAIKHGDFETRYNLISKSTEIISGLQSSLDFESGGDIAQILHDYYASIDARLFAVHRSNDVTVLEGILKELRMMRNAWNEIDGASSEKKQESDGIQQEPAMAEPAAPVPPVSGSSAGSEYSGVGVSA